MRKYNSFINAITINYNPVFHDVLYIVEYSSGKNRYIFYGEMSYEFSQRIHNFISTGLLVKWDKTERRYKYGQQNIA